MLTIRGLGKRFGDLTVFDAFDFSMKDGEFVAIVGPSGSGKTTLLNLVAGLSRPTGGTIDRPDMRVGYVFQEDRLFPWLTLEENIRIVGASDDKDEARRLISLVGLDGFESYYPDELSGGMRQRASIARAYYYRANLLLMDEPFSALDYALRQEMLRTLLSVRREREAGVLFVTHHVADALMVASRIVVLSALPARIVTECELGPTSRLRDIREPRLQSVHGKILNALN
jgi:ABC-type nitrate/sulfonate/bicarbonate transport system, ATPase component